MHPTVGSRRHEPTTFVLLAAPLPPTAPTRLGPGRGVRCARRQSIVASGRGPPGRLPSRRTSMGIVLEESLRGVFYAPYYAALALHAYAEEGVEVVFTSAATPELAARGLLDGTVDATWGGPMRVNLTYAREPGCDLQCFC